MTIIILGLYLSLLISQRETFVTLLVYLFLQITKMALNHFINEIVVAASIDFDTAETQDICAAVDEMLNKYVNNINKHHLYNTTEEQKNKWPFEIEAIKLAGSMSERTSMWKMLQRHTPDEGKNKLIEIPCMEFDYLANLRGLQCQPVFTHVSCPGHMVTESYEESLVRRPQYVSEIFKSKLCDAMSADCACFKIDASRFSFSSYRSQNMPDSQKTCAKCTVYKPTGHLNIALSNNTLFVPEYTGCSFTFVWTSHTNTYYIPDAKTLAKSKTADIVLILIDLVPAINLVDNTYKIIVAKQCNVDHRSESQLGWRLSCNLSESDIILNKWSHGHRKCYMALKFLFERYFRLNNTFHVKLAFLHHYDSCIDEDIAICLIDILNTLESSYTESYLKTWGYDINILMDNDWNYYCQATKSLKEVIMYINKEKQQIKSETCVQLLMQKLRLLEHGTLLMADMSLLHSITSQQD